MGQIMKFQIMNFYRRDSRTIFYLKKKKKKGTDCSILIKKTFFRITR